MCAAVVPYIVITIIKLQAESNISNKQFYLHVFKFSRYFLVILANSKFFECRVVSDYLWLKDKGYFENVQTKGLKSVIVAIDFFCWYVSVLNKHIKKYYDKPKP